VTTALDSSALVGIVLGEDDAEHLLEVMLRDAGDLVLGAPTRVEAAIVLEARHGPIAVTELDQLLAGTRTEVVPVGGDEASVAVAAWRRFGKGRHPAALNFGDCLSYAVARTRSAALLFKGQGFPQTDITAAR
jgi:ribonuclease VapC